jgi:CheY-like chemotaxis protein
MLVDDQRDWIRLNKSALERAGMTCEGFTDRDEALRAFKANPQHYVLVLLDVNLGGQPDGVAMAKIFLEINPAVNLVLISTQAQLQGREKDLEEIAAGSGLKYFRKKGDEQGGKQIVDIARQYFLLIPDPRAGETTQTLPAGALQTWLEASEEEHKDG